MKKAIIKTKIHSRVGFFETLDSIGFNFEPDYWQHDRIYVPRNYKAHANFPRLIMRTEMRAVDKPAKYSFILKRHIEDSGVDIVEETEVDDYEKLVNIILQLGFKPMAEVSRRRQSLKMSEGNYIYLDKVDNLQGYYAKIESTLVDKDSVFEARQDLEKTFHTLGESNFIDKAYFEL